MANISNKNILNFTKNDYASIIEQINNRLAQDSRFANFRESALAQLMIEIFASTTDFINYYTERRAEESAGFDTAQLRSSIIALANQLGYVIQRPVPASSSIKILFKGPFDASAAGLSAGDTISFTRYTTNFTYNGFPFTLKKSYDYTFTNSDIVNLANPSYIKTVEASYINDDSLVLNSQGNVPTSAILPIEILQGEFVTTTFTSTGGEFQKYQLDDLKFSNYYGSEDISYDSSTGTYNLPIGLTKVGVGNNESDALLDANLYEIDRRSLLTSQTVLDSTSVSADIPEVCTIRTRLDEGVDIQFGDGVIASKPSTGKTIAVKYFKTDGSNANKIGVINKKIDIASTLPLTNGGADISSMVEFRFNSNIIGGADLESVDSIKINAPSIFYSLDRLVTKDDYVSYLKSLTTPINVRNAIAWGENEEVVEQDVIAIQKLFNVILYSVVGSMYYQPTGGTFAPKSLSATADYLKLDSVLLEGSDYNSTSEQSYFNVLVKGNGGVVTQLGIEQSYPITHPITIVKNKLKKKAQVTCRHIYISPILQEFYLTGSVYINSLASINDTKKKINNKIYEYLDDNADFAVDIYLSKIYEIIESYDEVRSSTIEFVGVASADTKITNIASESEIVALGATDGALVSAIFNNNVNAFIATSSTTASERTFYNTMMLDIYQELGSIAGNFRDTDGFTSLMTKYNNTYKSFLRNNIIDSNGDITSYSLKNEIPKIEIAINYSYRS